MTFSKAGHTEALDACIFRIENGKENGCIPRRFLRLFFSELFVALPGAQGSEMGRMASHVVTLCIALRPIRPEALN